MLNRKDTKLTNGAHTSANGHGRTLPGKARPGRRRFIISPKAPGHSHSASPETRNGLGKVQTASQAKAAYASSHATPAAGAPAKAVDLTETIKTLLHLAHEHGHVTYDDINDILPDGLSPDDLDELYSKLRNLDVEIERPSGRMSLMTS